MGRRGRYNPDIGPGGSDYAWMAARPEVDWGKFMPNLEGQRRSENVEDYRRVPWTPSEWTGYLLGGQYSSPAEVLSSMYQGLQHPFTAPAPKQVPYQQVPEPTQLGNELGYMDAVRRTTPPSSQFMIKALRGN